MLAAVATGATSVVSKRSVSVSLISVAPWAPMPKNTHNKNMNILRTYGFPAVKDIH